MSGEHRITLLAQHCGRPHYCRSGSPSISIPVLPCLVNYHTSTVETLAALAVILLISQAKKKQRGDGVVWSLFLYVVPHDVRAPGRTCQSILLLSIFTYADMSEDCSAVMRATARQQGSRSPASTVLGGGWDATFIVHYVGHYTASEAA